MPQSTSQSTSLSSNRKRREFDAKKIEELRSEENFPLWKDQVLTRAACLDAEKILEGKEARPTEPDDLDWYLQRRSALLEFIKDNISTDIRLRFLDIRDPKILYDKIVEKFTPDASTINLKMSELHSLHWSDRESVNAFYSRVRYLVEIIRAGGQSFDDMQVVTILMSKLPRRLHELRTLFWGSQGKWTLDQALNILDNYEKQQANIAQLRSHQDNRPKSLHVQTRDRPCQNCGQFGHHIKECRQPVNTQNGQQQRDNNRPNGYNNQRSNHQYRNNGRRNGNWSGHQRNNGNYRNNYPNNNGQYRGNGNHNSNNDHQQNDGEQQQQSRGWMARKPSRVMVTLPPMKSRQPQLGKDDWVLDTGCTNHMCNNRNSFITWKEYKCDIECAGKRVIPCFAIGNILIETFNGSKKFEVTLHDVLYVPDLEVNLLSLIQMRERVGDVDPIVRGNNGHLITSAGEKLTRILIIDRMMYVDIKAKGQAAAKGLVTITELHEKLGHVGKDKIKKMVANNSVEGLGQLEKSPDDNLVCRDCSLGKMTRKPCLTVEKISKVPGARLYVDLAGPMETKSIDGKNYWLLAKDEATGFMFTRTLATKAKEEVSKAMDSILQRIKQTTEHQIKVIRTDGGTEFCNERFDGMCRKYNIFHELTCAHSPQMNGQIERENRTVEDMIRTVTHGSQLPMFLWSELIFTAVYTLNRVIKRNSLVTPYELWYGKKPNVAHMRSIGTICFVHVPNSQRKKLEATAIEGILIGYGDSKMFYRVYYPKKRIVRIVKDVRFIDNSLPNIIKSPSTSPWIDSVDLPSKSPSVGSTSNESIQPQFERMTLRSHRAHIACEVKIPSSFKEAINSSNHENWKAAMDKEIMSLRNNNTWLLVERPTDRDIVSCRWVYQSKQDLNGIPVFKARLVARGFTQQPGIDYEESYAPVTRYESLRLLLALAAQFKWQIRQFDVSTAFLNAPIDRDIFIDQPEGYSDGSNRVCKLIKAIYGLIQSPRLWHETFAKALIELGFIQVENDQCIFILDKGSDRLILISYVDDGLLLSSNLLMIEECLTQLKTYFKLTVNDRTDEFKFIGLDIIIDDNYITLSARKKIDELLTKHNLVEANTHQTPMEVGASFDAPSDESNESQVDPSLETPFRQIIGSLNFIANTVRPDICYSVNRLAQFSSKPSATTFKAAKRVVRYLKATRDLVLQYGAHENLKITCYSDASFAEDKTSRRSCSGSLTLLNDGLICWFSRKQKCISLSTFEAEFYAVSEATKDVMWLKKLLEELDVTYSTPIDLLCDNTATIANITNRSYHNSTKHVDYRTKFTREKVMEGWLSLSHVPSNDQLADFCTKPLPKDKHVDLVSRVMIDRSPPPEGSRRMASFSNSLFTRSITFLALLSIFNLIDSSPLLPRVSPVIWKPCSRDVVNGSMILHFNIEARSPCDMFRKIGNDSQLQRIYSESCERLFKTNIESKLSRLYDFYRVINYRHKRSWWSLAAYATPVIAVAAFVSAPVSVAVATIVSVGLTSFAFYSEFQVKISDVETEMSNHKRVLNAVDEDLKTLRNQLVDFEKTMDEKLAQVAEGSTLETQLIAKFTSMSHDLDDSVLSLRQRKLMEGLIHAFDLRAPCKERCPQHLWEPLNFTRFIITHEKEKHVIYQYTVRAMLIDKACQVLEAHPFTLISRNDTHTCEQLYSGEKYIMFNHSTTECPISTFNQEQGDLYYRIKPRCDDREETWETLKCRPNTAEQPDRTQVRPYLDDVYIYCYTSSIKVFGQVITCPNYVFKLPLNAQFSINDFKYVGDEQRIIPTMFKDQMMMEIINLHVRQPRDPHWFNLKTDEEMKHLNTRAYSHAFYPLFSVVSVFIFGCCAMRFYKCCRNHNRPSPTAPPPYCMSEGIEMSRMNHGYCSENSRVELQETSPLKIQSPGATPTRRSERTRVRRML